MFTLPVCGVSNGVTSANDHSPFSANDHSPFSHQSSVRIHMLDLAHLAMDELRDKELDDEKAAW